MTAKKKEFKKAISGINKELGVLGSEMKKVSAQYSGNKNSVKSLSATHEVLTKKVDTQKDKVESLKKALENSKKAIRRKFK